MSQTLSALQDVKVESSYTHSEIKQLQTHHNQYLNQKRDHTSFADLLDSAYHLGSTTPSLISFITDERYKPDLSYQISKADWQCVQETIAEPFWDEFDQVVSKAHFDHIYDKTLAYSEYSKVVSSFGWKGQGLTFLMALADPSALGLAAASSGMATPWLYGTKASRLARMAQTGLVVSTPEIALEAINVDKNPTADIDDLVYTGIGSFILGGVLSNNVKSQRAHKLLKEQDYRLIQDNKFDLSDKGKAYFKDVMSLEKGKDFNEKQKNPFSAPDSISDRFSSVGALRHTNPDNVIHVGADEHFDLYKDSPYTAFGTVRIDMVGQGKNSSHPLVREYTGRLAQDGVGNKGDNQVTPFAASEYKDHFFKTHLIRFQRSFSQYWDQYRKIHKIKRFDEKAKAAFLSQVADAIENQSEHVYDSSILSMAGDVQGLFKDVLQKVQSSGYKGLEGVEENINYFTHLWDSNRLRVALDKFKLPRIEKAFARAILKENPHIPSDTVSLLSKNFIKKLRVLDHDTQDQFKALFTAQKRDDFKNILIKDFDIDDTQADLIVRHSFPVKIGDEGQDARGKHRLKLDVFHSEEILDDFDRPIGVFKLTDLMNRQTDEVFISYLNRLSGHYGAAKVGLYSEDDFLKVKRDISDTMHKVKGYSVDRLNQDLERMDVLWSLLKGRPSPLNKKPHSTVNRVARLVKDYNFIRVMNQSGAAQIAELGTIMGSTSFDIFLSQIPSLKGMLKRSKTGHLEDDFTEEVESWFGLGADRFLNQPLSRYDYDPTFTSYAPDSGLSKTLEKGQNLLNKGKRFTADISGLAPINTALQRLASRIVIQNFGRFSQTGIGHLKRKLSNLGLSEDDVGLISKELKTHSVFEKSSLGFKKELSLLNLDKWDADIRDKFILGVRRWSTKVIQENDIGNLNKLMTTTSGQLLTQFRTFMFGAWTKQFLSGLNDAHWHSYASWALSMFWGGVAYMAQTGLNSIGQGSDYLDQRLSVDEIAKASFQRAGFASLMPATIDSISGLLGQDPLFSYGRTTGLASSVLMGNPTIDLINDTYTSIGNVSDWVLTDDPLSQGEIRKGKSLLPYQNAFGISQITNLLTQDLP